MVGYDMIREAEAARCVHLFNAKLRPVYWCSCQPRRRWLSTTSSDSKLQGRNLLNYWSRSETWWETSKSSCREGLQPIESWLSIASPWPPTIVCVSSARLGPNDRVGLMAKTMVQKMRNSKWRACRTRDMLVWKMSQTTRVQQLPQAIIHQRHLGLLGSYLSERPWRICCERGIPFCRVGNRIRWDTIHYPISISTSMKHTDASHMSLISRLSRNLKKIHTILSSNPARTPRGLAATSCYMQRLWNPILWGWRTISCGDDTRDCVANQDIASSIHRRSLRMGTTQGLTIP